MSFETLGKLLGFQRMDRLTTRARPQQEHIYFSGKVILTKQRPDFDQRNL